MKRENNLVMQAGTLALALALGVLPNVVAAKPVTAERILDADQEPGNWLTHGRTYSEQRYSPLDQINDKTIARLGLVGSFKFPHDRGIEATPIVVDGVMYVTGPWSTVYALDARSGKKLWGYDPKVDRTRAGDLCCDAVNRGVAVWGGNVYFGTLDGRLVALDAGSGKRKWEQLTIDLRRRYSITGAPRVVKGKVLIGNGGSEMGVRGYISAYDAATGKMAWRFYTVPGDPSKPFETKIMEVAAKTWNGEWWTWGGGGTVWDAMSYDPDLDLVYVGTGNASPWNPSARSPGGGDNLFLSSIVAIRPDSGEYVWHYQLASDAWDFPATSQIVLADLTLEGRSRKVLMQVPKHGFVYVVDRVDGKLISAEKFTKVNWASGYDLNTGRPMLTADGDYSKEPKLVFPGAQGGHNWQPISFSPRTGLLYFSETTLPHLHINDPSARFEPKRKRWNLGQIVHSSEDPKEIAQLVSMIGGSLIAWDPVAQKQAWKVPQKVVFNGGTLATAGNLVFHGSSEGQLVAYAADRGSKLWSFDARTGVLAGPVTYTVGKDQYVAVAAGGPGGAFGMVFGDLAKAAGVDTISRVLIFKLDGKATLPPAPKKSASKLEPPPQTATAATIDKGRSLYNQQCVFCHGLNAASGASFVPDLRYMSKATHDVFIGIVLGGLKQNNGMPIFVDQLSIEDTEAIRAYVIMRAHETKAVARK